jgi:predicted DNA-binding transcriptional regulator AlpA
VAQAETQFSYRDLLLTESQAARLLGISVRTLQAWRVRGGGSGPRYVRISSRCVRYRVPDLEEWIETRLRNSTSDQSESE